MRYGLLDSDLDCIVGAMRQIDEIEEGILFGSRAKGNYKKGSDVDLVIKGDRVTWDTVVQLWDWLNEESPMPYFFDVVQYETISEPKLLDHIDRVGVTLYQKQTESNDSPFNYATLLGYGEVF